MSAAEDSLIAIPNLNKHKAPRAQETVLSKSIENMDLSYIQEFIVSGAPEEVKSLSLKNKRKLMMLLVEFLDQPLRLEAVEMIYEILNDVGHIDELCKELIKRSNDFNKLIYLKGKIDYLRHLDRAEEETVPENEYSPQTIE